MSDLYPILDWDYCNQDLNRASQLVRDWAVLDLHYYQFRSKGLNFASSYEIARELKSSSPGLDIYANDYIQALDCKETYAGLHLGQQDLEHLSKSDLLRLADRDRSFQIGYSSHNLVEIGAILELDCQPDYIAMGPCYPTDSKKDTSPQLHPDQILAMIQELARHKRLPKSIVFIGGFTVDRVQHFRGFLGQNPYHRFDLRFVFAGIDLFSRQLDLRNLL